jgi:hypothetical protein
MSATVGAVIGVAVVALLFVVVVGWLVWSSRIDERGSAEARYRKSQLDLHSPRNRKAMRAKQRRTMWASGSAGAAGIGYPGHGGSDGGCGGGAGCGGGGCGGGGN